MRSRLVRPTTIATIILAHALVRAAGVNTVPAVARGSGGQQTLAVAFDSAGQLHAAVCARAPCSMDHATTVAVPEAVARRANAARLNIVGIGLERRAVVVEVPEVEPGKAWKAVVAAPLTGGEPVVAWSGYTGLFEGIEGERSGPTVLFDEGVYVGTEREGRDLCGRRAILDPKVLDPRTLTLVPAKVQRLSEHERDLATPLAVRPAPDVAAPRLLLPSWETSAAPGTSVSNLVDDKMETVWAEGRSGVGRGEFAVLRAAREIPIAAFELDVPSSKEPNPFAVPRDVYVATDHELFKVTLPKESAQTTGARYDVSLPAPIHTSCVAIVFDSAFSDAKEARVALAEVRARPAMDADPATLVDKIQKGGPDAEGAAALLRVGDRPAFEVLAARFPALDENARRIALDVLDDAPCEVATPVYVEALAGPYDAQRDHARSAFPRCASVAGPVIARALEHVSEKSRATMVDELSGIAPGAFVGAVLPLLGKAKTAERRLYRTGIARASLAPDAHDLLAKALADERLGPVVTVDVLRALGGTAPTYGDAAHAAFSRVSGGTSFRTRYLLLGPAATLAATDNSARAFLRSAIASDPDARIRAEASRSVSNPRAFYAELARGLADPAVRVREAAASALGTGRVEESGAALVYRLKMDAWPMVRRAAARALSDLGRNASIDSDLGNALMDESPEVRREVLRAIGVRGATSEVEKVRDRFSDDQEDASVRSVAAMALGKLCDTKSTDALTKWARKLATPTADEPDRIIGRGALAALTLLAPTDLKERLAPFFAPAVPRAVTELAAMALAARGQCRPSNAAPRRNARE